MYTAHIYGRRTEIKKDETIIIDFMNPQPQKLKQEFRDTISKLVAMMNGQSIYIGDVKPFLVELSKKASTTGDENYRLKILAFFCDLGFMNYPDSAESREHMAHEAVWNYKSPLGQAVASEYEFHLDLP